MCLVCVIRIVISAPFMAHTAFQLKREYRMTWPQTAAYLRRLTAFYREMNND